MKRSYLAYKKGVCQNGKFWHIPFRCVRIDKMQGIEGEGDRSLLS